MQVDVSVYRHHHVTDNIRSHIFFCVLKFNVIAITLQKYENYH